MLFFDAAFAAGHARFHILVIQKLPQSFNSIFFAAHGFILLLQRINSLFFMEFYSFVNNLRSITLGFSVEIISGGLVALNNLHAEIMATPLPGRLLYVLFLP